jgi:hypothetical protein
MGKYREEVYKPKSLDNLFRHAAKTYQGGVPYSHVVEKNVRAVKVMSKAILKNLLACKKLTELCENNVHVLPITFEGIATLYTKTFIIPENFELVCNEHGVHIPGIPGYIYSTNGTTANFYN